MLRISISNVIDHYVTSIDRCRQILSNSHSQIGVVINPLHQKTSTSPDPSHKFLDLLYDEENPNRSGSGPGGDPVFPAGKKQFGRPYAFNRYEI